MTGFSSQISFHVAGRFYLPFIASILHLKKEFQIDWLSHSRDKAISELDIQENFKNKFARETI